jgi:hypothetical protein
MILVSLHTKSSSIFHAVCLQIAPTKMENPDNEDIIIQIEETPYHDTCIINQKIQCKQCYYSVSCNF